MMKNKKEEKEKKKKVSAPVGNPRETITASARAVCWDDSHY